MKMLYGQVSFDENKGQDAGAETKEDEEGALLEFPRAEDAHEKLLLPYGWRNQLREADNKEKETRATYSCQSCLVARTDLSAGPRFREGAEAVGRSKCFFFTSVYWSGLTLRVHFLEMRTGEVSLLFVNFLAMVGCELLTGSPMHPP